MSEALAFIAGTFVGCILALHPLTRPVFRERPHLAWLMVIAALFAASAVVVAL